MSQGQDRAMSGWAATLLAACALWGGCQDTIRSAFSYPQDPRGPLLTPIPRREFRRDQGWSAIDDKTQMIVDASARRASGEKGAPRELAVTVTFLDREGRPVDRKGSFALAVSVFDERKPGKAGEVLAAFRAEGEGVQAGRQEGRFERGYAFRLALDRQSRQVEGKLFTTRGILVVVVVRFFPEEGGGIEAVSAPILFKSRR
ncbi:MAG: hypothetical protein V2A58_11075 [Planctomycetota bacterium]